MKKKYWLIVGLVTVVIAATIIILLSIPEKQVRVTAFSPGQISPGYQKYVLAFTSGVISTQSEILVVLSDDYIDSTHFASLDPEKLFSLKPEIPGRAIRINARTVAFQPFRDFIPGEVYTATFHLDQLLRVPDSLKRFEFGFQIMHQAMEHTHAALGSLDRSIAERRQSA